MKRSNVITLDINSADRTRTKQQYVSELIERYSEPLRRHLQRWLVCKDDVEDIMQETFFRMMQHKAPQEIVYPRAFLFKVAVNLAIDRNRKNVFINSGVTYGEADPEPQAGGHKGRYSLDYHELVLAFQQALHDLPPVCKQVFLMRCHDDLKTSEISRSLGISMRMVQKHLAKALMHFHDKLR